jgi:hypothetical protein
MKYVVHYYNPIQSTCHSTTATQAFIGTAEEMTIIADALNYAVRCASKGEIGNNGASQYIVVPSLKAGVNIKFDRNRDTDEEAAYKARHEAKFSR